MIGLLIPLVLVGLLVWMVRNARGTGADSGVGEHTPRRLLQYPFLLAAAFTAASGLTRLVDAALPAEAIAERRASDIALGLSLSLVGIPVWWLLWRLVAQHLRDDPGERSSTAWSLYLVAATTVSLVVAFVQLVETGRWLVGVEPYEPDAVATAVVWGAVWLAHTRLLRAPRFAPSGGLAQLVAVAGAMVGLVGIALGAAGALRYGFEQVYRLAAGPALVDAVTSAELREDLVVGLLAVPVWWWHWLREGVEGPRTTLWHAYVMLVAVLGGLLTAVVSAAAIVHTLLAWLAGVPDSAQAAVHFASVPGALAAAVTGVWVWGYHGAALEQGVQRRRSEPERAYGYLAAGVGLVAAVAGATVAIMAAIQAATPGALATTDPGGRDALVTAATLLLVGTPLWAAFWRRLQSFTSDGAAVEREAPSRRAYLFVLFGVAGLTATISLAVILFVVFRDLLEQQLALTVLYDLRAGIGLVITAGAVSAYHWTVYRDDRDARSAEPAPRHRSVLLLSSDGHRLAAAVADGTGAKVRRLRRLDAPPRDVAAEDVTAAILASPYEHVLVTVEDDGRIRVIPYEIA